MINDRTTTLIAMNQSKPAFWMTVNKIYNLSDKVDIEFHLLNDNKYINQLFILSNKDEIKDSGNDKILKLENINNNEAFFSLTVKLIDWDNRYYYETYKFGLKINDVWKLYDSMPYEYEFGNKTERIKHECELL